MRDDFQRLAKKKGYEGVVELCNGVLGFIGKKSLCDKLTSKKKFSKAIDSIGKRFSPTFGNDLDFAMIWALLLDKKMIPYLEEISRKNQDRADKENKDKILFCLIIEI